uniref:Uncharacterized protein n=1 Tax=Manihot esculenta TaxID=3983 RepID=A0A251LDI0_MANES
MDSEVTSIAPSSLSSSPCRSVCYAKSSSWDSHNGEKTAPSFHYMSVLSLMDLHLILAPLLAATLMSPPLAKFSGH